MAEKEKINNFSDKSIEEFRIKELEKFKEYRDNYLDELPEKILLPTDENYYLYKCRDNFIGALLIHVAMVRKKLIKEGDKINNLKKIEKDLREIGEHGRKTEDDIKKINEIIDFLIKELS